MERWYRWFHLLFLSCVICLTVGLSDEDLELRHNPNRFEVRDPDPSSISNGFSDATFSSFEKEVENAIHRLEKQDEIFYNSGVDFFGGSSAIALHAMIINTRPKSVELGKLERERIYAIHSFAKTPAFSNLNRSAIIDTLSGVFQRVNSSYRGLFTSPGRCPGDEDITCDATSRYRTIDGSCNNLKHPRWGKSFIPMRRFVPPEYSDGVSTPRSRARDGSTLPNPRLVSRLLHSSDVDQNIDPKMTHMVMQWGQFLDHDLTSTPMHKGVNQSIARCCVDDIPGGLSPQIVSSILERDICFPISIPPNDETFFNRSCLNFVRSIQVANSDCKFEPVEQLNQLTAYIDASQVYGSSKEEQGSLRMYNGGYLKFHQGGLLPRSKQNNCIPEDENRDFCFLAGDERVNEQVGLTSIHTVWLREHNRIAEQLCRINPHWDDQRCFQETRKIIGAMMQHITYNEFIPALLNKRVRRFFNLDPVRFGYSDSYNENVDASIRNVFATSAFRLGHTLIRSTFSKLVAPFSINGHDSLRTMFGNTSKIISSNGKTIPLFLGGMTRDHSETFDRFMTPELTQRLFLDRDGHSLDLASLNIQRGRDHGVPGYNAWRRWCKLSVAHHFGTGPGGLVDHNDDAAQILGLLYNHPDDIDPFAGMMSEKVLPDSSVGPTVGCLIGATFQLVKEGDRFWYESSHEPTAFSVAQLHAIRSSSLARVLCDNTVLPVMQPWVMQVPDYINNPIVECTDLPFIDLSYWREITPFWSAWSEWADCRDGYQHRHRTCSNEHGGCRGPSTQQRPCPTFSHISVGVWASWTSWTPCMGNRQRRYRMCLRNYDPVHTCIGDSIQSLQCRKEKFCPFLEYSVAQQACLRMFATMKPFA